MAVIEITHPRPRIAGDRRFKARLIGIALTGLLVISALFGLGWGAAGDTDVIGALLAPLGLAEVSTRDMTIIWDIRAPRVLTGILVGASLAVSGAVLQGLFRNPLADPGLVGVSAGASLGAVIAIVAGSSFAIATTLGAFMVPVFAFVGGWITTLILYRIACRGGRVSVATMLLAGIALAALTQALVGLLIYQADDRELRDLTFWGMGSLAGATWFKLMLAGPIMALSLVTAPFLARGLNALTLGEPVARHLGIPVERMKRIAILTVAGSVGAAVAITGGIGFVGIVVPHLLRLAQGPDHKGLLLNSALLGGALLLLADALSRTIVAPAELPIGIVTAAIGGPFFIWILLRNRGLLEE